MKVIWLLLVACWFTSIDVLGVGSNETDSPVSNNEPSRDETTDEIITTTELIKYGQSRSHYNENSQETEELCPCYPKGRAPVFQNLDLNQFGVKRLVIYLYYSELRKQLEVHVPNKAKQKLIPDIYEDGDILETLETPCLVNTFNKYIDLMKPRNEDNIQATKKHNTGKSKHKIRHDEPNYIPEGSHSESESKSSDFSSSESDGQDTTENPKKRNKPKILYKEMPIYVNGKPVSLNQINSEIEQHKNVYQGRPNTPSYQASVTKILPVTNLKGDKKIQYIPSGSYSWNHNNKQLPYPHSAPKYKVHGYDQNGLNYNPNNKGYAYASKLPYNTPKWIGNKYTDVFWKYPYQPKQYEIGGNYLKDSATRNTNEWQNEYTFLPWTDNKQKLTQPPNSGTYIVGNNIPKQTPSNVWYKKYSEGSQTLPIDIWLKKEFKKLHNPSKSISDLEAYDIKYLLEQILIANDMTVSPHGYIVNGSGQNIDLDRLSLRPILIGGPLALNQVLKNKNNKLKLPNSPYLKAVLLTTTHPMKILGTVPLGETYLPSGEFTYSGEVDDNVHDYNVPTVPVYNLKDDYRMNMKYYLMPQETKIKKGHLSKHITVDKNKDENKHLEERLQNHTPPVDTNHDQHNHHHKSARSSHESVELSASQVHENSNKSHHPPDLSNQTNEQGPHKPKVTILNLKRNEEDVQEEAKKEVDDKSDNTKSKHKEESAETVRHGGEFESDWAQTWHNNQRPTGLHKLPYYTDYETGPIYDNYQIPYFPGFRIVPGKNRRHYNVEPLDKDKEKPITNEVYKNNGDSNDSLDIYPGFRIIGGHAATSSGAPLSNKGRSGHSDDSISNDSNVNNL